MLYYRTCAGAGKYFNWFSLQISNTREYALRRWTRCMRAPSTRKSCARGVRTMTAWYFIAVTGLPRRSEFPPRIGRAPFTARSTTHLDFSSESLIHVVMSSAVHVNNAAAAPSRRLPSFRYNRYAAAVVLLPLISLYTFDCRPRCALTWGRKNVSVGYS